MLRDAAGMNARDASLVLLLASASLGAGCAHQGTYTCEAFAAGVGESCARLPCVDGAECVDGTCRATAGPGDVCGATTPCAWGLLCEGGACVGGRALEGEWCPAGVEGACAEGLGCSPEGSWSDRGTCIPQVGRGEECRHDVGCAAGLYCVMGRCGDAPTEGMPCSRGRHCADGLICGIVPDSHCLQAPVAEGDLCGRDEDCPGDLHCYREAGDDHFRCHPRALEGERCSADGPDCAAGLYCHSRDRVCAPLRAPGGPCTAGELCEGDFVCQPNDGASVGGTCLPRAAPGSSCRNGEVCALGSFCDRDRDPPRPTFCVVPGC